MSKLVHRGINVHRLQDVRNKKEIILAKAWRELNRLNPEFLGHLLGREPSQSDAETAATIIQALGERKNFLWLEETLKKCQGLVSVN